MDSKKINRNGKIIGETFKKLNVESLSFFTSRKFP